MLPNGRRLGAHLPLAGGLVRTADRAAAIGASALQVFTDNPSSWRRRADLPRELPAFRERLAAHGIAPLAVHAPYLANLASPDPLTWERSVDLLASELRVAAAYGSPFVNVHTGSHRGDGAEAGVARIARAVAAALAGAGDGAAAVVLENSAGAGFTMGARPSDLAAIARAAADEGVPRERLGFCLDTAHLWGAGCDIGTADGADALLAAFDAEVGLGRLWMVHLNDSRADLGSGADRHEHLGAGRIGTAGLARLLVHPALGHVAYILETPGMEDGFDAVNIARARALAAGQELGPLPEAEPGTRGGRAGPARPGGGSAGASP